jgi:hypothetical protein
MFARAHVSSSASEIMLLQANLPLPLVPQTMHARLPGQLTLLASSPCCRLLEHGYAMAGMAGSNTR